MPQAVMHILVPLILMALFKDWYDSKHKNKFPLRYVLIAGIAGLIPDLDISAFWILHFFGFAFETVHKTIAHTLFVPLLFLIIFLVLPKKKKKERKKLQISVIFLMFAIGSSFHILLDMAFGPAIPIIFPFSTIAIGINLASYLPIPLDNLLIPSVEAVLLVFWLIYLEWKHKISDFI